MYFLSRLILLAALGTGLVCALSVAVTFSPWSWCLLVLYVFGRMVRRGGLHLWGHGTARWAGLLDLKRAGMFSGSGLILGRFDGRPRPGILRAAWRLFGLRRSRDACRDFLAAVRLARPEAPLVRMPSKTVHTVVFAPVGAGKSTGLVIPFLLTNPDSCIVIDFKGELATATAAARRRMGHRVVILDPYGW